MQNDLREHLKQQLFNGSEGAIIARSTTLLLDDVVQAVTAFFSTPRAHVCPCCKHTQEGK